MCRSCGALVGAGEANCGMCGTPLLTSATGAPQRQRRFQDAETLRFVRAIISRPATFTFVFLIANIFLFLMTALSGGTLDVAPNVLVAYGAKFNGLINQGEWWRFVTPIFLHGNALHLLFNMYGLFMLGPYVEKLYGSARFVVFWVVTGIVGVVASYLSVQPAMNDGLLSRFIFKSADAVSVGASGALFGLIGVLFVFGIKFRHELPEGFKQAFGTGMLPTILLNIFIGFAIPVIDNAAHLGGLAAGAVLALFVGYKRPHQRASIALAWHALQIASLALVIISFAMVALRFNSSAPTSESVPDRLAAGSTPEVIVYLDALNAGQIALLSALKGSLEPADEAFRKLEQAPRLDDNANQLREDLRALLARARDVANTRVENEAERRAGEQVALLVLKDFREWEVRQRQWLRNDARNYGLMIKETPQTSNDAAPGGEATPQPPSEKREP